MSARPGPWDLLGVTEDPVPGDPYEVGFEATHYATVAAEITDQVARLRALAAGGNELVGRYATSLTESAGSLADHLGAASGRFTVVGQQLTTWQPALETARADTLGELLAAEDAAARVQLNAVVPRPSGAADPIPQETQLEAARARRHDAAVDDLGAAVTQFHATMAYLDDVAEEVARRIRDACEDDLKDSLWDGFSELIHDIAPVLSALPTRSPGSPPAWPSSPCSAPGSGLGSSSAACWAPFCCIRCSRRPATGPG